jgi:hypothetical protein
VTEAAYDLTKAEQFALMYKSEQMNRANLRLMLVTACGIPEDRVEEVIDKIDQTPLPDEEEITGPVNFEG